MQTKPAVYTTRTHMTKRQMANYIAGWDEASVRYYMRKTKEALEVTYVETVGSRNMNREQNELSVHRAHAERQNRVADRGTPMADGSPRMRLPRVN
jgi:hypothetical protein